MEITTLNTPTSLTLSRLIISPLVLPLLLVYFLPYDNTIINSLLALFFVLLSLTDFFDGYLARKYNQVTDLGKALDPLADKFLFFSALIALVVIKKIFFYWAILFIAREFFIMGLRILALERGFEIPVSWAGKCKTFVQMAYITFIIAHYFSLLGVWYEVIETLLLVGSLTLSFYSAYAYYISFKNCYYSKI